MDSTTIAEVPTLTVREAHDYLTMWIIRRHEEERADHWKRFKRMAREQPNYDKATAKVEFQACSETALAKKRVIGRSALDLHIKLHSSTPFEKRPSVKELADRVLTTLPVLLMAFTTPSIQGDGHD